MPILNAYVIDEILHYDNYPDEFDGVDPDYQKLINYDCTKFYKALELIGSKLTKVSFKRFSDELLERIFLQFVMNENNKLQTVIYTTNNEDSYLHGDWSDRFKEKNIRLINVFEAEFDPLMSMQSLPDNTTYTSYTDCVLEADETKEEEITIDPDTAHTIEIFYQMNSLKKQLSETLEEKQNLNKRRDSFSKVYSLFSNSPASQDRQQLKQEYVNLEARQSEIQRRLLELSKLSNSPKIHSQSKRISPNKSNTESPLQSRTPDKTDLFSPLHQAHKRTTQTDSPPRLDL